MADGREMFTIRARDKTTQKDLILKVPKDASIEEVMSEYTRKFNEQEGKQLSKDEFRFVSNGQTVGDGHKIEDLPTSGAADGSRHGSDENDEDETSDHLGCGSVACTQANAQGACVIT
mmetsp:Transcript_23613/g.70788  ORF Transcript_23613/g.70788 Transcript_23613/m.70788 type:complete len:118 (+) Transcript_23613:130-483(+)